MTAKRFIFTGRVQGVGFRYAAHGIANRLRLTGFVRNLPDGDVEMLVQGQADDVEDCLDRINAEFSGYIREMRAEEVEYDDKFKDFRITF